MNGDVAKTPDSKKQKLEKTPKSEASLKQSSKTPKQQEKTPKKLDKTPKSQDKTPKSQEKTPKILDKSPKQQGKTPQQVKEPVKTPKQNVAAKTPQKRKLPSGITVEELKEGHGPEARNSKMVRLYTLSVIMGDKTDHLSRLRRQSAFKFAKYLFLAAKFGFL